MRGPRSGLLGAPLRASPNAAVLPLLVAVGVFGRVRDTTLIDRFPTVDDHDPAVFMRWLEEHPDPRALLRDVPLVWALAAAVATVLVLTLSILAHEVGHAAAARRAGLRVEAIDLGFSGGWVTLRDVDALTAGKLAAIAAAGPAVTALLAAASYGALTLLGWPPFDALGFDAASAFEAAAQPVLAAALWVNLFCLVLNLLPIPPLDGHKLWIAGRLWRTRHGR